MSDRFAFLSAPYDDAVVETDAEHGIVIDFIRHEGPAKAVHETVRLTDESVAMGLSSALMKAALSRRIQGGDS